MKTVNTLLTLAATLLASCNPVTKKMHEVNEKFRASNAVFAEATSRFVDVADAKETQLTGLQRKLIDDAWTQFLASHTSQDGRLVSRDASGVQQPLLVEDLEKAMNARLGFERQLLAGHEQWVESAGLMRNALEKFKVANETTAVTEAQVAEAEESLNAFFESTITAVGGVAAGFGLGAAVLP